MGIPRIDLAETSDFDLGGLRVRPAHRQVSMQGECRELEPKVAQVLIALASASPAVVSRDRLVEQCWDGRIVGNDALNRCILALRHLAKEFSPEPFAIETIPRVGYALIAGPANKGSTIFRRSYSGRSVILGLLIVILFVAAMTLTWTRFRPSEIAPASVAVLPFRNLSAGDSYFAEGVSEEILAQLTREPAFRVTGPASAAEFKGDGDARKVGRNLGVDYVVQGTVRPGTDRVRINAALIRTNDGTRLWAETYDRKLDDILEIQRAIGQAVANGLKRKLVHPQALMSRQVKGEAYALYLNARGLLRSGNPQSGEDAVAFLRNAARIDPAFAPAWSSLAEALELDGRSKGNEGLVAILPQAVGAARQALLIDPDLAQAHGVLAKLLGADQPEGFAHVRRAAELDPRSSEGLMWRSFMYEASVDCVGMMKAQRRAHELDPYWQVPLRALVDVMASCGDRRGAEELVRRKFPDPLVQNFALGRVARLFGDYSEAARRWSTLADSQSRWAAPSTLSLHQLLYTLKLSESPPSRPSIPILGQNRFIASPAMPKAPSAAEWRQRNRSPAAALVYRDENALAAKLMLKSGRAAELVAIYDGPSGLLGIRQGAPVGVLHVRDAATVVLALRQVGRVGEADSLLRRSGDVVRTVNARPATPIYFDDDAAGIWALQGKPDKAVDALERAFLRGWVHAGRTDLSNIADEPALHSLRAYPRFKSLVSMHRAHFARERQETASVLKLQL